MTGLRKVFGAPVGEAEESDAITEAMDIACEGDEPPWGETGEPVEDAEGEAEPGEGLELLGTPLSSGSVADVAITAYGSRELYSVELDDEAKGRRAIIKEIVKLCRASPEYRRYVTYLRESLDMGKCSILSGLSDEELSKAGVELHHHPLTLYDICEVVLSSMEFGNGHFSLFRVAHRVMALHWRGMVGLVPLAQTMHEMAHDGQIRIDPGSIYGDWVGFVRDHESHINPELAEKIRAHVRGWEEADPEARNSHALALEPRRWAAAWPELAQILQRDGAASETEETAVSREDVNGSLESDA